MSVKYTLFPELFKAVFHAARYPEKTITSQPEP